MPPIHTLLLPAAFAVAAAFPLAALAQSTGIQPPPAHQAEQSYRLSPEGALRRPLARGVYQVVYSPAQDALYVASAEAIPNVHGGLIYKLDPVTLETTGLIHTDEKNFGLDIDPAGETLFVTHSVGASASKIDLESGKVLARVKFEERSADGTPYGPREVLYDAATDTVYVGGVGDPGRIWAIDAKDFTVRTSIPNAGKWVTGLLREPGSDRLFAANGDGEVLVIDTATHEIRQRWKPAGKDPALLLNLALDAAGNRLFVTDHSRLKTVLVLDAQSGELRERLPVGESMDILYRPENDTLYLTHRERGKVSVLDGAGYAERAHYSLPPNPNSLALSPDGKVLFVTVKTPFNPDYSASGEGSIVRIELP